MQLLVLTVYNLIFSSLDLNSLKYLEIAGGEKESFGETRTLTLDGSGWAKVLETVILGDNVLTALKDIHIESTEE